MAKTNRVRHVIEERLRVDEIATIAAARWSGSRSTRQNARRDRIESGSP